MEPYHRNVIANGISFHIAEQGEGPLVILLHGFPEFWYSWRHQLGPLAEAGFHAVAPDMRGYNLTDKPEAGYDIETLVEDVVALVRALGSETAHVVGHDWGGIIAWQAAWRRPDVVRSLAVLNAPHPGAYAGYVRRHPAQLLKSSYMLFFQIPGLAEWALTRRNASAVARAFRRAAGRPDAFTAEDIAAYRRAFLRPGVATAALNYYRRAVRQGTRALPDTPIDVPTLVLWGERDPVLERNLNDGLERWVKDVTIKFLPEVGHWTQQEAPGVVTGELVEWLRAREARPAARAPAAI
jgi:pimeloyl-ACP methyl ester carboxylesterase